jgi:hypothetical protein
MECLINGYKGVQTDISAKIGSWVCRQQSSFKGLVFLAIHCKRIESDYERMCSYTYYQR